MTTSSRSRGFCGVALIGAAILLVTAMAIGPFQGGETRENLTTLAAHKSALLAADILVILTVILLIPGSLGVLRPLRERAPRLAPVAVGMFLVGWIFVLGMMVLDRVQLQAATGMSLHDAVAYVDRLDQDAALSVVVAIFIIGHTLGGILLGIALAKTRFVQLWAGALVSAGAVLHPVARVAVGSHGLDVVAFALLAVGLVMAGLRVASLTDDEREPAVARRAVTTPA